MLLCCGVLQTFFCAGTEYWYSHYRCLHSLAAYFWVRRWGYASAAWLAGWRNHRVPSVGHHLEWLWGTRLFIDTASWISDVIAQYSHRIGHCFWFYPVSYCIPPSLFPIVNPEVQVIALIGIWSTVGMIGITITPFVENYPMGMGRI